MAYDPPSGDAIILEIKGGYTPPPGDAIVLGDVVEPRQVTPDFSVPWGQFPPRNHSAALGWSARRRVAVSCGLGWDVKPSQDRAILSSWQRPGSADKRLDQPWSATRPVPGVARSSWWRSKPARDHAAASSWSRPRPLDQSTSAAFVFLRARDRWLVLAAQSGQPLDVVAFAVPWINPPAKDRFHDTVWGRAWYAEICWRRYQPPPGDAIVLNIHQPLAQVGDGAHIDFFFDQLTYDRRCAQREPSGRRDANFYQPLPRIPSGEVRRCYFVLNTALLTRLPERTPIDVTSLTVAMDVDSFCWSLNATVGSVAALDLLRPGAPVEVEVNINGHLWIVQVDRWNQSRRFAGGDRSVSGRSRSANLAAPFGPLISLAATQDRTAEQLAQAALDEAALAGVSGWTVAWDLVDWLVPGNTWTIADQTPMQAIQAIAQAADGIIQTHRTNKVVQVRPRYGSMPWTWATATPAVIVPEAMVLTIDGSFEPKIQCNAAFVAGTTAAGVSAKVTRAGTAGDVTAPMVTDPLITATEAALAKGRGILAASGNWEQQRLSIPLFPAATAPGLVLPGTCIRVAGSTSGWNGQVIGTSITASRTRGGVVVRQTLDVERYRGN